MRLPVTALLLLLAGCEIVAGFDRDKIRPDEPDVTTLLTGDGGVLGGGRDAAVLDGGLFDGSPEFEDDEDASEVDEDAEVRDEDADLGDGATDDLDADTDGGEPDDGGDDLDAADLDADTDADVTDGALDADADSDAELVGP